MKINQQGIAHLQLLLGVPLVIGLVGFAAYRVGTQTTKNQQIPEIETPKELDTITIKEEAEPVVEEVIVPKVVEEVAPVVKPEPVVEPKKSTPVTKTEPKKTDQVWLEMTKVSAEQSGSQLLLHSRLPKSMSGTCHFKLWQDGYDRVYSNSAVTDTVDCIGTLNLSGMSTYDGWSLHVWFDAIDGVTHGYQAEAPIALFAP